MKSFRPWAGLRHLLVSFSVCLLGPVFAAGAAESPSAVIRSTTEQALNVLKETSADKTAPSQQQLDTMWVIVLPRFDTQEIARRALGANWSQLTGEQQTDFTSLFIELLKSSYSDTLKRYSKDAQVAFDPERIEGEQAEVPTRLSSPAHSDPFSVVYRLHRKGEAWLIYDVVAEDVSLVKNYRAQFARIMAQSSGAGLLEALRRKIAELHATRT
jgi:phospholipid transport system substrate-binding protein